jgi:hypothetical protein
MGFLNKNLFTIILIISVVCMLFLCSPVYKIILGKGNNGFRLVEGMTTSQATSLGLTGNGNSSNPYIIPQKLIVRPADAQWKKKIQDGDTTETGVNRWILDTQFKTKGSPNYIGDQYQYFAEWWLAKYNPNATPYIFFAANVLGNTRTGSLSNYGLYKFVITAKNSTGISYTGLFNRAGWSWSSAAISPPPTPVVAPAYTLASYGCTKCSDDVFTCTNLPKSNPLKNGGTIPESSHSLISGYKVGAYDADNPSYTIEGKDYWWRQGGGCPISSTAASAASAATPSVSIPNPTSQDKASFESKKCNKLSTRDGKSTRDGNCIPVCVPISGGSVVGPPRKVYGNPGNAIGPDGLPFNQNTANYFFERSDAGSVGQYYPITDMTYTRMTYGADTDCTKSYECAPIGSKQSDGSKAKCSKQPEPPKPTPSGPCDPSCRKVKDPRLAKSACKLDKSSNKIVCYACPLVHGSINCNNFRAKCSGCGADLMAQFDQGAPYPEPGKKEKPFSPTECEKNCEKPGVRMFKKYLDTFRDGSGFDDGSCEVIGRNTIKCRPVRKGTGVGQSSDEGSSGGMKPIPSADECILCDQEELQGYAKFDKEWDNYAKQNDYINVKIIDKPRDRRGASYGPSDGSGGSGGGGGSGGSGNQNWQSWDGGDSTDGAGWRGKQTGGWYQTMSDVRNRSFQVAAANAESSRQQAYIESLKLELNKLNDDYTTQKAAVNNMKGNIDKQVSSCNDAKSKLSDAKMSSISDDMNKNAAITLKEKVDANTKAENIAMLEQNVKTACDNATQLSNSYNNAMKQLGNIDKKRQILIEKLVIAMNSVTDNKTTININLGGGAGGMGDCGDRLGCGTGIEYNNMYTSDYFKPQYIDNMINKVNIPMPYQDIILF